MKKTFLPQLGYILMIIVLLPCKSFAQNANKHFSDLHEIVGTWSLNSEKGMIFERWTKLNDSTLTSINYLINGYDTTLLEKVQLILRDDKIMYVPIVADQNSQQPVTFTLAVVKNRQYIFENTAHDYPQRIVYNLPANNLLHAWVEGNSK